MNKIIIYILLLFTSVSFCAETERDSVSTHTDTIYTNDTAFMPMDSVYYKERSFDAGFQEKYTDTDFEYQPKTKVKSGWDRFVEAIIRFLNRLFSFGGDGSTASITWNIIKILIAFVIIGFAVYMIARAVLNKEGMWIFGKSRKNIMVQDIDEEDIAQMNLPQLIHETKAAGNYRLAIRYYYLLLLKKLSEREIIHWHKDKTNSDYLYEIKNTSVKNDFEYLSYVYDYSWYGEFPIDDTAFNKAEKAFQKTLNTI